MQVDGQGQKHKHVKQYGVCKEPRYLSRCGQVPREWKDCQELDFKEPCLPCYEFVSFVGNGRYTSWNPRRNRWHLQRHN